MTWRSSCPGLRRRSGTGSLRASKAEIIARAAAVLDPAEARAAEAMVLDRAGRLTPGGLRAAIARAVMEVAPAEGAQTAGAGRAGRPGAAVGGGLRQRRADGPGAAAGRGTRRRPADHRVGAGAEEGRAWTGSMDELRARAYLDLLLDKDSRPASRSPAGTLPAGTAPGRRGPEAARPRADRPRRTRPGTRPPDASPARCRPGSPGGST